MHVGWKLPKMSHLNFSIFYQFLPMFDRNLTIFGPFLVNFCKSSSLRSQCVEWDFLCDFQNTVSMSHFFIPLNWVLSNTAIKRERNIRKSHNAKKGGLGLRIAAVLLSPDESSGLENTAWRFLPEWVGLLGRKSHQQVVLVLMIRYELL